MGLPVAALLREVPIATRAPLPQYLQEGFILAYSKTEAPRFHVLAGITASCLAAWTTWQYQLLLIVGVGAGCAAYYFYPFTESRVRLGANQYGLFIDGFGLIAWRAIGDIRLATYSVRTLEMEELQIQLSMPLNRALIADWRRLPIWRLLMRLPWTMSPDNTVRINLQPFAPPAEEVHRIMHRLWQYYR
jgi:hypothetical protein